MKFISSSSTCLFHVLFLPLAVCLLYANTLHSPFVLDDSQILENNAHAPEVASWQSITDIVSNSINKNRVVPNFSFAVNYAFNGDNVVGYHVVNIAVHSAAAISVYFLLTLVFFLCLQNSEFRYGAEMAFFSALLWALHPLQTNAVTYIIQRMTSMAALFYLLSVIFYIKARLQGSFTRGWYLYVLTAVSVAMALLSKENTAVLPITLFACEIFFLQKNRVDRQALKKNVFLGTVLLVFFGLLCLVFLGKDPVALIAEGYKQRDFTLVQRLLTEPRVIFYYLTLLVLPLPSRLNIAYDYPLSTGLLSPPHTLLALISLVLLGVAVVVLFKRCRLTSFAIFWFLINLSIESSFIPLMIIFEHRMYLPSVFLISAGIVWCYRLAEGKVQMVRWGVTGLIVLFAIFSWQRNTVWKSERSLWGDVVVKSPGLAWGHVNLGKVYAEKGEYKQAELYFRKAIALDQQSGLAYLNLGTMYEKQNRLYEANMILNKALNTRIADQARLFTNLAIVNLKLKNFNEAIIYAGRAIELRPDSYKSYDVQGVAYLTKGDYQQAEKTFVRALEVFPEKGEVYIRLAVVYEKQGRLEQAVEIISRVLSLENIDHARAYNQLGILFWHMKKLPESIRAGQKALEINPGFLDAYLTLGISYEDSGQMDLALEQFRRGWQNGLDMISIYNSWAGHHVKNNNPDRAILYLREAIQLESRRAESYRNLSAAYALKGMNAEAELYRKRAEQLSGGQ